MQSNTQIYQQKFIATTGQAVHVLKEYEYAKVKYAHVLIPLARPRNGYHKAILQIMRDENLRDRRAM
jgi:hypothetical protein